MPDFHMNFSFMNKEMLLRNWCIDVACIKRDKLAGSLHTLIYFQLIATMKRVREKKESNVYTNAENVDSRLKNWIISIYTCELIPEARLHIGSSRFEEGLLGIVTDFWQTWNSLYVIDAIRTALIHAPARVLSPSLLSKVLRLDKIRKMRFTTVNG